MPGTLSQEEFCRRARRLKWLLFDIDGVLTDGGLFYTERGESIKKFDVKDGFALKLAQGDGLKVGVLSGRASGALKRRATELGLDELILNQAEKGRSFLDFLTRFGLEADEVGYVGDDLMDLPVLLRCGLSFAPADAVGEVRARVHLVLRHRGGCGVARELVEEVLAARGTWQAVVDRFTS